MHSEVIPHNQALLPAKTEHELGAVLHNCNAVVEKRLQRLHHHYFMNLHTVFLSRLLIAIFGLRIVPLFLDVILDISFPGIIFFFALEYWVVVSLVNLISFCGGLARDSSG